MEKLGEIIFYSLETTIKTYRQMAQRNIYDAGMDITIDQWLVMKVILENSHLKQGEIAGKIFKDAASVTRIIDMLIQKKYITREVHNNDRRRTQLKVTVKGKNILKTVQEIVSRNRSAALNGIPQAKITELKNTLSTITANCKN